MATGIISLDAVDYGYRFLGHTQFWFNVVAYLILMVLTIVRTVRYSSEMRQDFFTPSRAVGFFTWVASTNILGSQTITILSDRTLALVLWLIASFLWLALIYTFFTISISQTTNENGDRGPDGAWLLLAVSTQSIAVLGSVFIAENGWIFWVSLAAFFIGGWLYFLISGVILARLVTHHLPLGEITPPYWITMGAAAISCLAGIQLASTLPQAHSTLHPLLTFTSYMFWAIATWWIPLLIILEIRRFVVKRIPLRYSPELWAFVFPLGMYSACTHQLSSDLSLTLLSSVSEAVFAVAILAWLITFVGMGLYMLAGKIRV